MPEQDNNNDTSADGRFADHRAFRESLFQQLRRQVFGPSRLDGDDNLRETLTVSPLQLYATGILFPQHLIQDLLEGEAEPKDGDEAELLDEQLADVGVREAKRVRTTSLDEAESSAEREPLNLANEFSPAACGISFHLARAARLSIKVSYGRYASIRKKERHPRAGQTSMDGTTFPAEREVPAYQRRHAEREFVVEVGARAGAHAPIPVDGDEGDLKLHVIVRRRTGGTLVVSAMLVNGRKVKPNETPAVDDVYFQVELSVKGIDGGAIFLPIDRDVGAGGDDTEVASLDLLYRHRRSFALGHGVAGDWNRSEELSSNGRTDMVATATLPSYELKPIAPRETGFAEPNLQLSMSYLYDAGGSPSPESDIVRSLSGLATDYQAWIDHTEEQANSLEPRLRNAALLNLRNCRECLRRVRAGIEILSQDSQAMLAFRLMNKAMLIQQFHSSTLRFRPTGSPFPEIPKAYGNLPKERKWRPFQLAFVLMNIAGVSFAQSPERAVVDLIWFPTGGGKTEAYLGLSAFTICLERLRGSPASTTVLMRYTLRLLTAQQFQRASALVLALEVLRQDHELGADLGESEISIGLWVGRSLSPNRRSDARTALQQLQQDAKATNPFQVLQCPWCGVDLTGTPLGYQLARDPESGERTVRFVCPDPNCRFGAHSAGLPIVVVDDDIYARPPTILIGTVDKFAQVAWDDRVGRLFGIGIGAPPPALVIQDELHLISGPLGSVVGLYETAIDRMCSRDGHIHKIVASTATIRRAQEQCRALYAREAFEFPPQAIRAGETYFALEDQKAPGRLYVGFMGTAVKSHQTALVRSCAPLLQAVCIPTTEGEQEKRSIIDPYGTLVWYFNSLRELGHAATLCMGDIPEFLKGLRHRLSIPYEDSRYLREIVELTSRMSADEIPGVLQQLEIPWAMKPSGPAPVDILLATNMIAVGVDVSRLGLFVVSGQPKSTSEYIQATSRVGRQHPGLVLTVYVQTKSRDRSHYERFISYHQSLYKHVEPTSVTPFSPPARSRAMRGVLVALARQIVGVQTPDRVGQFGKEMLEQITTILSRIGAVDPGEVDDAEGELLEWLAFWKKYAPPAYGPMAGKVETATLAYPFGGIPDPDFQREAWPVMTSMRNVDGTSQARVLNVYDEPEIGEGDT